MNMGDFTHASVMDGNICDPSQQYQGHVAKTYVELLLL